VRRLTLGAGHIYAGWATPSAPVFPLKQDQTNRYRIDSNNVPFLMVGDGDRMPVPTARWQIYG
jgi:hypothetical protein